MFLGIPPQFFHPLKTVVEIIKLFPKITGKIMSHWRLAIAVAAPSWHDANATTTYHSEKSWQDLASHSGPK